MRRYMPMRTNNHDTSLLGLVISQPPCTFHQVTRQQQQRQQLRRQRVVLSLSKPSLHAIASAGVSRKELDALLGPITFACQDQEVSYHMDQLVSIFTPATTLSVPGTTGRVICFQTDMTSEEEIFDLQCAISQELDELQYSETPALKQPILLSIGPKPKDSSTTTLITKENCAAHLGALVEGDVQKYEMTVPLPRKVKPSVNDTMFVPSICLELDGANVTDQDGTTFWDTSTVLVFDNLVSHDLRKRLLDVVLGKYNDDDIDKENVWDDIMNGPDPNRWERGGLLDIPNPDNQNDQQEGRCWGLTEEAIDELCFEHHDALQEFETILSDLLPDFVLTRFPEAVLSSDVSPLTANAPTAGDSFDYHIDADPYFAPPSPWTDVYGRYPNRFPGKPRFMSCLVYVNDDWNAEEWGAPTRILDVATDTHYNIQAIPGRCVLMDQDITHTVVAPQDAAGKRPRYSLVWKLILHPKTNGQIMTDLAGKRKALWPKPILFGSAAMKQTKASSTTI